jgi:hypothetical protein
MNMDVKQTILSACSDGGAISKSPNGSAPGICARRQDCLRYELADCMEILK